MTIEEKISVLKQVKEALLASNSWLESTKNPIEESFDMAIEALEQQTCEDCISREAVIDINEHFNWQMPSQVNYEVWKEITALPSVTPKEKTGWILVSERLPEDKTYVLTTIKVPKRIAHARSGWYDGGFFMNDNGDTWRATDKEVIAWMPLPEPYKAESEDKE